MIVASAPVGSIWRAKPPGKERVEVERRWLGRWFIGDQVFAEQLARCRPLTGGRPLIIPVEDLEAEFDPEAGQ